MELKLTKEKSSIEILQTVRVANIRGKLVEYHLCSTRRREPMYKGLYYIGKGYIYSINGVKQEYTIRDKRHFWIGK